MDQNKHLPWLSIILATLTFILVGLTGYLIYQNQLLQQQINSLTQQQESNQQAQGQACTLEAKICPDGSSVGRTGPNCEFTPCPEITTTPTLNSDPTADWKIYKNQELNFGFQYPQDFTITSEEWINAPAGKSWFLRIGNSNKSIFINYEPDPRHYPSQKKITSFKDVQTLLLTGIPTQESILLRFKTLTYLEGASVGGQYGLFFFNQGLWHIYTSPYNPTSDKKLFDQILSTFQFLD
jgi:hypothetical protein